MPSHRKTLISETRTPFFLPCMNRDPSEGSGNRYLLRGNSRTLILSRHYSPQSDNDGGNGGKEKADKTLFANSLALRKSVWGEGRSDHTGAVRATPLKDKHLPPQGPLNPSANGFIGGRWERPRDEHLMTNQCCSQTGTAGGFLTSAMSFSNPLFVDVVHRCRKSDHDVTPFQTFMTRFLLSKYLATN